MHLINPSSTEPKTFILSALSANRPLPFWPSFVRLRSNNLARANIGCVGSHCIYSQLTPTNARFRRRQAVELRRFDSRPWLGNLLLKEQNIFQYVSLQTRKYSDWRLAPMIPMMNMYETIRDNLHFNKFSVGELLFVEYKCPIEQDVAGVWTPVDYFVHVVSGKKTWRTTEGSWTLEKGQTLFFKKGAAIVHQDFREDFCLMVFFVSDDFIRDTVREISSQLSGQHDGEPLHKGALMVNGDMTLAAYFQSMLA